MNIVCATDDNFVQHCCVMLTSVLLNNKNVNVFILTEGLSELNYSILKDEVESKKGVFNCIIVDSTVISKFPMPISKDLLHISQATYYRLLMSDILPIGVEKAIYLDCDIIVRKSLIELWECDITNYAIGAIHQITREIEDATRLNYPIEYGYFNAGVLLINIAYWRKNNIPTKLFDYIGENYNKIKYHDQDVLNAVLYNQSFSLEYKWNMLGFLFENEALKLMPESKNDLIKELKDPTLIHFTSSPKPWDKVCLHPYRNEYFKYMLFTLYYKGNPKPNLYLNSFYYLYTKIIKVILWIRLKFNRNEKK